MSDWALEMSFPGRGWGDPPALVAGVIGIAMASTALTPVIKRNLALALVTVGLVQVVRPLAVGENPLSVNGCGAGSLADADFIPHQSPLRGMRITESRQKLVDFLQRSVKPSSTCFVYGNVPMVYDLLHCSNPTLIDTTAADFFTGDDAERAIATLRAHPPDYLVTQDTMWMNPPLSLDLGGDVARYGGLNPRSSMVIHVGLRSLLDRYEQLGYVPDVLGPTLAKQASEPWDVMDAVHLYRRKD